MLFLCVAVCEPGLSFASHRRLKLPQKREIFSVWIRSTRLFVWSRFAQGLGFQCKTIGTRLRETTQTSDVCSILGCGRPDFNSGVFMSNRMRSCSSSRCLKEANVSRCSSMVQIINLFFFFFFCLYRCDFYLDFKARHIGRDALLHDGKIDKSSI